MDMEISSVRKRLTLIMSLIIGVLTCPCVFSDEPAFDCHPLISHDEKVICEDANIAKLDRDLNIAYDIALSFSSNPSNLKKQQRAWLQRRTSCGGDPDCMEKYYLDRLQELDSFRPEIPTTHIIRPGIYTEKGTPWSPRSVTIKPCGETQCFSLVWGDQNYLFTVDLPIYQFKGGLVVIQVRASDGDNCRYMFSTPESEVLFIEELGDCFGIHPASAPSVSGNYYFEGEEIENQSDET